MTDAKIVIETLANNQGIKDLSAALGDAQAKLKETRQKLKDAEKAGNLTAQQMKALRAEFNQQKLICGQLNSELKRTAGALTQTGQSAGSLKDQLKGMVTDKLGIDLDGLVSKFTSTQGAMLAVASAAAAMSAALVSAGREMSAFSNQFIAFAGNAQHAKKIYDEFNEVYRNTNYDEQQVYNMGKAFMSLGMNAKESAALVMECADAAAAVGKGVEFADELANAFKRLYTGGELTERQLKSMAEAGIDLSSVQEEIRAGGEEAFKALKTKLGEYEGGMNRAKQTAGEMEGDIKGNLIEIGRQTAYLVDEFFGFSDALREFYQWVINTTQTVINSIKGMVAALHNARAAGDAYAKANEEWEANYADIWEQKRKDYATEKDWERDRAAAIAAYANATADVVVESENRKQEAIEETTELARHQVQSIAKTSGSGGGSSGGGGGAGGAVKDTTSKDNANGYRELQKALEETLKKEQAVNALKQKGVELTQQIALIGTEDAEHINLEAQHKIDNINAEKAADEALQEQRLANYDTLAQYITEHPFDGSDKVLENLTAQQEQEALLFAQRITNYEQMLELAKQQRDYDLWQDSQKLTVVQQQWESYAKSVSNSMATAVTSVIMGEKSIGQALSEMAKQIISNAVNMLAQWVSLVAILAAFGDPAPGHHASVMMFGSDINKYTKKRDGGIIHRAAGGFVGGAGSNRSDSIPAMLSNGEFVLNSAAVNSLGADNLARINAAGENAGDVAAVGRSVTMNISAVDAASFGDFLARGGLQTLKQAMFDDDRSFGAVTAW